ncbi:Tn3 family transposase [Nocardia sp. SYP-A9097]|uniref:Tn3 family transposase n=1 Tax=Nocardia sp. SYP-A9097 TaxID=2663237 RepID=UPI00129A8B84|nr:Tn3 family transposase [Nocardia sp. SYP-A9097]MRH90555.1 Tn3 family transposase [Nocardia sp. SYP-A9097]
MGHSPYNVIESRNRANSVIYYGKTGELASNRADEQELSVQCLRIVQASLGYVNTLMIQDLLGDPDTGDILVTPADKRGVTPLFWEHILPYGEVKLNMTSRLILSG